jgi:hypothetical protein
VNTILNYYREEAIVEDSKYSNNINLVLAAFWGFIVTFGFVISTLLPIISIIKFYDYSQGTEITLPVRHPSGDPSSHTLRTYPVPPGVIAYTILKVPLFYTMLVTILTHLLRRQIIGWFEHVLYMDDEEAASDAGANGIG